MKRKLKKELTVAALGMTLGFMVLGLAMGLGDDCTYKSILARANIPYIIGCEIGKPRWNE